MLTAKLYELFVRVGEGPLSRFHRYTQLRQSHATDGPVEIVLSGTVRSASIGLCWFDKAAAELARRWRFGRYPALEYDLGRRHPMGVRSSPASAAFAIHSPRVCLHRTRTEFVRVVTDSSGP